MHRMVNAEEFLGTCADVARGAILCGHMHYTYRVRLPDVGPEILCAGSATMDGREGLWMLDVEHGAIAARRGRWLDDGYVIDAAFEAGPGEPGVESPSGG
jgi:hypothetical protein